MPQTDQEENVRLRSFAASDKLTAPKRFHTIEVARGVAATLVVAFHSAGGVGDPTGRPPFGNIFAAGYHGVDFFFVLSGFIIAMVHVADLGNPRRFPSFLWKRFVRVYPIYWFVLSVLLTAHLIVPWIGAHIHPTRSQLLEAIILWPQDQNVLFVAWTLSFELLFYGIFSIAILDRRLGYLVFFIWQVAVLATNLRGEPQSVAIRFLNIDFLLGACAAFLPVKGLGKWLAVLGTFTFSAGMVFESRANGEMPANRAVLLYGISAAMIVYGLKCWEQREIKAPRSALLLGGASYSIYLIHAPVMTFLLRRMNLVTHQPEIACVIVLIAGLSAGIVLHLTLERPMLSRLRRFVP